MRLEKQTHQVTAEIIDESSVAGQFPSGELSGYEIHMGESECGPLSRPLFRLTRRSGKPVDLVDGAISPDGKVWGTYLHGLFDNAELRRVLIDTLWHDQGKTRTAAPLQMSLDKELDRLAAHLEASLDMNKIFALTGLAG